MPTVLDQMIKHSGLLTAAQGLPAQWGFTFISFLSLLFFFFEIYFTFYKIYLLKYIILWSQYICKYVQTSPLSNFITFSLTPKETLYMLALTFYFPSS